MTSESRPRAPDPTSRLRLPRGRRHVRLPGAGARNGGAAPGAARPFVVSACRPRPGSRGWTRVPPPGTDLLLQLKKMESKGRVTKALARSPPPSAFLPPVAREPEPRGSRPPVLWESPGRVPTRAPHSFQKVWPSKQTRHCPCPSEYSSDANAPSLDQLSLQILHFQNSSSSLIPSVGSSSPMFARFLFISPTTPHSLGPYGQPPERGGRGREGEGRLC